MEAIRKKSAQLPIKVISEYYERGEIYDLLAMADCYVSLHRAEGFGLPLAEAMYLGKPVIATAYSGNMDFMNVNNSYLVRYTLVELEKDIGPYGKSALWAEPDTAHAGELMSFTYSNRDAAKSIGRIAAGQVRSTLDSKVLGRQILKRLDIISRSNQYHHMP